MIVRILFILLILLILSVVVQAQDHENVDPVTSFCQRWGMVNDIVVQGDYAYFGTSDGGLQILDASNPENPLLAGSLMTEGVYGLCLTEEIAYTVGYDSDDYEQRDGYFAIIDITDPGSPLLHSTMETDQRAYCVTVSGDYAFVGVNGFMKVMDISDPRNPHLISEFEIQGNLEHICTNGDIAYLCASDLVAVNISNPEEPRQIATADLQIGGKDAELFGDYLIVADSYHYKDTRGTIRIFDISNPENIEEILEIEAASLNVGIVEDRLFAINDYQILQIYNISNIEDIELIAEYDSGEEVMYFEVSGNLVFLSHQGSESDGYHIGLIDATDPEEMELLNEYIKPRPTRIALDDQFAFIYSGSYNHKSLKIFDTSNLESIREIANYPSVEGIQDMKILDDVLFLTGNSGLYLFDIQNPESVRSLSHLELSGYESFPQNGYVYTKTQDGNIAIIDVSDVDDPQQVGDIDLNLEIADFDVSGDYAYLANRDSGMVIYNISNPSDPRQVAHLATKERVTGIEVEGQIAYLLLRYEHALQIVDVSDLDNLEIIGEYEQLPGFGSRMLIEDDYLYPFNRSGCSFKVFNKSDPNQLREVGYYQLTGQLQNLQLSDTLIYVVGNSNVEICRFEESGYFIVTPTSHDFGFVTFGENPEIQITIENTGNRSQSITNLISDNAAFRVDFNGEIEIAPGENHEATVTFDPEDDGPYSCILQIESDNPGGYIRQVRLTGESIRGKRFEEFGRVSDIHLTDEYAYMLQTEDTLMILDITNPAEPEQVGMRDSLSRASHIFYMDEKVFIARIKMDGISDMVVLTIYNVSDPESPIRRGTSEFTCSGPATDIEVLGHYAYISAIGFIFRYDIQNTGHPRVVGRTELGMFVDNSRIHIDAPYLFAVQWTESYLKEFKVFFLSHGTPVLEGALELNHAPSDVFAVDDYAYIVSSRGYFDVVDVSDVQNPEMIGSVGGMSRLKEVVVQGDYAYACGNDYIYTIDISDPENPFVEEDFYAPSAQGVDVLDEYIYVPANRNGMFVLALSGEWEIRDDKSNIVPESITLYPAFPNPFNSSTRITYSLPEGAIVNLTLFDISGREVTSIVNGYRKAGFHSVNLNASDLSSGLYFIKLENSKQIVTRKLMLIK